MAIQRHVSGACSVLNPFCPAARAVKRPDGLGTSTIGFQTRGLISVTTDAAGAALVVITPGGGVYGTASGTLAAGNWTLPAAWTAIPGGGFITTNAGEIRIVSMGAVFRSTASMTNCQGLLHTYTNSATTVSMVFAALSQNNLDNHLRPMTSGMETTWLAKPMGQSAHSLRPLTAFTTTQSDFDWTQGVFEITGGAVSTLVGYIEIVVNVEMTLSNTGSSTTGLNGALLTVKPANPVATQTQAAVHSTMSSFIEGGFSMVDRVITTAATNAINGLVRGAEDFGMGMLALV